MAMSNGVVERRSYFEELSEDLIDYILKKLISVRDYIRFGGVCRAWRLAALEQKQHRVINSSFQHQPPLLILPYDNSGDLHLKFYDFCDNKVYINDKIAIPSAHRKRQFYSGSSFGWLAFALSDFSITLINPFTNAPPIRLPPVVLSVSDDDITYPECLIYKVFFSCDPSAQPLNYVVAVIFDQENRHAAFIRPGEKCWIGINKSFMYVCDIVFSNGRLLAINMLQQLIVIEYNSRSLETSVAQQEHILTADIAVMQSLTPGGDDLTFTFTKTSYIVDIGNEVVLHVVRFYLLDEDGEFHESVVTESFKLYKLQNRDWVEIHNIGNLVLFLGGNASICTYSTPSFRPNCIYFTDDFPIRCGYDTHSTDMGIFDIKTKIIDKLCVLPVEYPTCYGPPAIWISSTL